MGRLSNSIIPAALSAALLILPATASADEGRVYVQGFLGAISPNDSADSLNGKTTYTRGYSASLAVGYGVTDNVRVEAEALRNKVSIDTIMLPTVNGGNPQKAGGSVTSIAFMANAYYDFSMDAPVRPYVGFGLGRADVAINDSSVPGISGTRDADQALAWQAKLGFSYPLNDAVSATVGYRFFDTRNLSFTSKNGTNYTTDGAKSHTFGIGLSYMF